MARGKPDPKNYRRPRIDVARLPTDAQLWAGETEWAWAHWSRETGLREETLKRQLNRRGWTRPAFNRSVGWATAPCARCGCARPVAELTAARVCKAGCSRDTTQPAPMAAVAQPDPAVMLFRQELARYQAKRRAEYEAAKARMPVALEMASAHMHTPMHALRRIRHEYAQDMERLRDSLEAA